MTKTKEELTKIIEEHQKWLKSQGGKRAVFKGDILNGVDLEGVDLVLADFTQADMTNVSLKGAKFAGSEAMIGGVKVLLMQTYPPEGEE